jgi:hypothetical protein
MYDNRNRIIQQGRKALETELYDIVRDRNRGLKFADAFIATARQLLTNSAEKFRRDSEKVWQPNEANRQRQYETAYKILINLKACLVLPSRHKWRNIAKMLSQFRR